jgi:hypothetical protein
MTQICADDGRAMRFTCIQLQVGPTHKSDHKEERFEQEVAEEAEKICFDGELSNTTLLPLLPPVKVPWLRTYCFALNNGE